MAAWCFPLKLKQFQGMDCDEINLIVNGSFPLVIPCLENLSDIEKRCKIKGITIADQNNKTTKTVEESSCLQNQIERISYDSYQKSFVKRKTIAVQRKKLKVDSKVEWEVENVVDVQIDAKLKRILYFIKWKNWGNDFNSWEPSGHLSNCITLLDDYHFSIKRKLDCVTGHDEIPYKDEDVKFGDVKAVDDVYAVISKYIVKREEVKVKLRDWEKCINSILPATHPPIAIENNYDLEEPPENFTFINECIAGEGVVIPDDPLIGCECEIDCFRNKKKCCVTQFDGHFAYNKAKKLIVSQGTPIYECNSRCKCGPDCFNRVVQHGPRTHLAIFRTSNDCGWGVKTLRNIKKDQFVMEYVGEVITTEEAEKRGEIYDAEGRTYLFDLDFNESDCPFTVDAAKYGNISHFMNHSCDPNLAVFGVWINTLDRRMPRLAYFSKRDIVAEEELTFDYMMSVSERESDAREVNIKGILCKCGAENCLKYLA